ncbi:MFS transporter [Streptomyces sp. A7024]|uniref:MFS transporter n=1 Tax=Streptomyces coryli TaxID=1128680 RepID=A0A6G4TZE3_9ACTN|nr:MFS transporter [Streptomyces coryli]NGN65264.1 MFS transporter [Streptomyces coryli]
MSQPATRLPQNRITAPPSTERRQAGGGFVAILAFCGITVSVMQTLVVPLVTDLPKLLSTTASNASWVITATLLAGAVSTPVMGRLGDMFGKRKMLIVALSLLVIGSLVCAVTSDVALMVVGRAIQGGAMGAIPLGISIMRDELPPQKLGSAMALMSSSLGIGGALGLPAAAFLAQHADWHTLFYSAAGLGVLSIVLVLSGVPESAVRAPDRFDFPGAIGLTAGLVCLLLPITKGGDWGWSSSTTLGLFGAAVVILVAWGFMELRTKRPLVDLRTTARRPVLLTNMASILVGFSFYAMTLVLPQVLQLPEATGYGLGQSMVAAGLFVAPMGVAMMLVSPLSARINASAGPKVSLMLGLLVIAAGYGGGIALLNAPWQTAVVATVIGAGVGIAYSAMPTLIIGSVPAGETGAANGLNTLMRSIGMSTSSAVVAVILAHSTTRIGAVEVPNMDGFRIAFGVASGAAVIGLLIAMFLPKLQRPSGPVATSADSTSGEAARADSATAEETPQAPAPVSSPGIRGRVAGPGGAPLAGAAVTLIDPAGRQLGRAVSDADGGYRIAAAASGTATLIAAADSHQPHATPVRLAEDRQLVQDLLLAAPEGSVRGTVRGPGGVALPGARVSLVDGSGEVVASGTTDATGGFAFEGLPRARYTVVASGYEPVSVPVVPDGGSDFAIEGVDVRLGG